MQGMGLTFGSRERQEAAISALEDHAANGVNGANKLAWSLRKELEDSEPDKTSKAQDLRESRRT